MSLRLVTYGAACSLDGFIAGPQGAIDWLHFSTDAQAVMSAYWGSVDTVLMGRITWEDAIARSGGTKKKAKKRKPAAKKPAITTYVFSRTLTADDVGDAELVSGDAGDFVRTLKAQPGKGICVMGGGVLAASLFEAGVIDEVALNIHPLLLGAGTPMFRDPHRRVPLDLVHARTIDGGCVLASYRVRHGA